MGKKTTKNHEVPKPHKQNIYFFPGPKVLAPPLVVINVRDLWDGIDDFFLIKEFSQVDMGLRDMIYIPLEYMIEKLGRREWEVDPMHQAIDLGRVPRDTGRLHAGAGFFGWANPITFTGLVGQTVPDVTHRCKCCHRPIKPFMQTTTGFCEPCARAGLFDDYPACNDYPHTIMVKGYGQLVGEYLAHKHNRNEGEKTVQL